VIESITAAIPNCALKPNPNSELPARSFWRAFSCLMSARDSRALRKAREALAFGWCHNHRQAGISHPESRLSHRTSRRKAVTSVFDPTETSVTLVC
jgi:hypothetical protein